MPLDEGLSGSLSGGKTTDELAREFQDVIIDRMEEIERTNRRVQRLSTFLLVLFVAQIGIVAFVFQQLYKGGMPAWSARQVSAREYVLTDSRGQVRGAWRLEDDGAVRLLLTDSAGKTRLKLSVLRDGGSPGVTLADDSGNPRAVLGLLPDQTNTLVFADRAGNTRAVLGLSDDNSATLVFADKLGNTRAGLTVDASGRSGLTLSEDQAAEQDTTRERPAPSPAPAPAPGPAPRVPRD